MLETDPPPLETARQKAERTWRNNRIIQKLAFTETQPREPSPSHKYSIHPLVKFRHDIRNIIFSRTAESIAYYISSVTAQKNKLLREKLKRLESEYNDKD